MISTSINKIISGTNKCEEKDKTGQWGRGTNGEHWDFISYGSWYHNIKESYVPRSWEQDELVLFWWCGFLKEAKKGTKGRIGV